MTTMMIMMIIMMIVMLMMIMMMIMKKMTFRVVIVLAIVGTAASLFGFPLLLPLFARRLLLQRGAAAAKRLSSHLMRRPREDHPTVPRQFRGRVGQRGRARRVVPWMMTRMPGILMLLLLLLLLLRLLQRLFL